MLESISKRLEVERQARRYFGIAIRRWRWLLLGFVTAMLVGGYRYLQAPRIYQATSQVLLTPNATQIMGRRMESVSDPMSGRWRDRKYEKTQHRLMAGPELSESVAKALNIHPQQLIRELEQLNARGGTSTTNPFQGASQD